MGAPAAGKRLIALQNGGSGSDRRAPAALRHLRRGRAGARRTHPMSRHLSEAAAPPGGSPRSAASGGRVPTSHMRPPGSRPRLAAAARRHGEASCSSSRRLPSPLHNLPPGRRRHRAASRGTRRPARRQRGGGGAERGGAAAAPPGSLRSPPPARAGAALPARGCPAEVETPEGGSNPYLPAPAARLGGAGAKTLGEVVGERCPDTARLGTAWGREPTGSGCGPRAPRALRPRPPGCPVKHKPEISWLRREAALPVSFQAFILFSQGNDQTPASRVGSQEALGPPGSFSPWQTEPPGPASPRHSLQQRDERHRPALSPRSSPAKQCRTRSPGVTSL